MNQFPFPWNGSPLVHSEYLKDNYRVIDTEAKTGRAIIFFSGNGLYYPNTEQEFTKKVIIDDRYEWEHLSQDKLIRQYYERIIFVRDVFKQWYINGINAEYDTADKTAELMKSLTFGFKVTTCGDSAGGYAAVLFASLIGAERFFSVSGQFSITHQINAGAPFVMMNASDPAKNKYYDISHIAQITGGGGLLSMAC